MQFGFNKHEYIFQRQQNGASSLSEYSLLPSKNLQELIYTKLHKNSCCYLSIIYTNSWWKKIGSMLSLFVIFSCVTTLHSCYNFAPVLHKNVLVFSQSDTWNFFMYDNKRIKTFMMMDVFARNLQQENNTDISIHNVLTIPVESLWKW